MNRDEIAGIHHDLNRLLPSVYGSDVTYLASIRLQIAGQNWFEVGGNLAGIMAFGRISHRAGEAVESYISDSRYTTYTPELRLNSVVAARLVVATCVNDSFPETEWMIEAIDNTCEAVAEQEYQGH